MYDKGQFVVGDNVAIGNGAWIWCHCHCDSGPVNGLGTGSLYIGDNTYIGANFHADCYDYVKIGEDCLIADDVSIISSNHGMNPEEDGSYVKQPFEIGKIEIGDGCWIGSRVTILKGSSIGKRSIIGANSVVTKSIPPYSIAVGSPARVIKKWSFDEHRWVKEGG